MLFFFIKIMTLLKKIFFNRSPIAMSIKKGNLEMFKLFIDRKDVILKGREIDDEDKDENDKRPIIILKFSFFE